MRLISLLVLGLIVSGCTVATPPETLKNLYEVEATARKLEPQSDMGLLYLMADPNVQPGLWTKLKINNESAMHGQLHNKFYVFCLPPKKYDLTFVGDFLIPNQREFLNVEPGKIYVRSFVQHFMAIWIIPLASSNLSDVALTSAKEQIATMRIGEDEVYQGSQFRCRKLQE